MTRIKKQLTLVESVQFINHVVDNCFAQDEEGNDIEYTPQYRKPAIQEAYAIFYTNYESTDDMEKNYEEYMSLNICEELIDNNEFEGMLNAISEQIEFRKQKMLQKNIKVTSILDEEIIKLSDVLAKAVADLPKSFDFSSIQPFVDKINSMKTIDEKKIVQAVVSNNHSLKNKLFGHKKPMKKVKNQDSAKNAPTEE